MEDGNKRGGPDMRDRSPADPARRPERRGVSRRSVIEPAKEAVKVADLAHWLCGAEQMRRVGKRWVARCPLPDHEDNSPSFTCYSETNSWFCYGCYRGGDVIELARFAWGYDKGEVAMAAANLLQEFGYEIPPRPPAWFAKQARQKPARTALEEAKVLHHQRRVFRIFAPMIAAVEDEDERRGEAELLWEAAGEIAARLVAGRSS
jgi:DNA primase